MPVLSCPACQVRLRLKAVETDRPILCPRCRSVIALSEVGAKLSDTFAVKEEQSAGAPLRRPLPRNKREPDEDLIDYRPKWHPLAISGMALGGCCALAS
jgi:hypothetical protein